MNVFITNGVSLALVSPASIRKKLMFDSFSRCRVCSCVGVMYSSNSTLILQLSSMRFICICTASLIYSVCFCRKAEQLKALGGCQECKPGHNESTLRLTQQDSSVAVFKNNEVDSQGCPRLHVGRWSLRTGKSFLFFMLKRRANDYFWCVSVL